jgi:hypothetical protein
MKSRKNTKDKSLIYVKITYLYKKNRKKKFRGVILDQNDLKPPLSEEGRRRNIQRRSEN